jgi:hypothetical protein
VPAPFTHFPNCQYGWNISFNKKTAQHVDKRGVADTTALEL